MRLKTSLTGKFAISRRPWIAAAALSFLVGTACTEQPEASDQGASPPAAADAGAKANPPPQEQARVPWEAPAEPNARAGAQDFERRQQRIAKVRGDRYAKLGLSAEQAQRIEALRAEQQAWTAEHRDEVRDLGNQRTAAWQAGDEAEAEAIGLQLRKLRETRPTEQDIVALLTDEQRAELRKNGPIPLEGLPPRRRVAPADAADAADAAEVAPDPS